ncbi:hypothetical protein [Streptomyces sp. NBC_00342]|uniref:hypothetical protein n=1 Tax=Streptomyces sp. NBC_00342 TaxID=2975718 RepID=UPI002E2C3C40|nr:hypothetical protein [Streptomyces sp. NBC_00342]
MAIEWERIGQPGFDRIVEALVHRMYNASASVEAVNGRGGDAGIDIKVTSGSRVRIFQLKYYPDGFPAGSFKGRRHSIKESFTRAMAHNPWEWVLVVPCTLTPVEREFVASLAAGQGVRVRVWDRAMLDGLMATHADLEASFTRDQLYDAAKVFGQERAMLMGGLPDVRARVAGLGRLVDGLDDHWTVDFARQGETVVQTLRGKHPRAHEISPVELTLTGNGPWGPELTTAVRRSLGFGVPEEVVLPREAVKSLTVDGPEWLSGEHRDIEVRWRPVVAIPPGERGVDVVFLDGEQVTASYPGTLGHLGAGSIGRSVHVELPGGNLELLVPREAGAPASMRFTFSLERLEPAAALRLLRMRQRIMTGGAFQVRTSTGTVGGGELPAESGSAHQEVAELCRYVEELDVVQRHCEQYFPLPAELSPVDRIALRMARLLVDGHCVISPFLPRLSFTLSGEDSPGLRALLSGGQQAVQCSTEEFAITLAGRCLRLGPVLVFHPRVATEQEDGQWALAALDAGRGDGCKVTVRPMEGERFRLLLQNAAAGAEQVPVPLGLPDFPEPR